MIKELIIVVDKRTSKKIAKITPLKEEDDLELFNELIRDLKLEVKVATKEDFEKVYTEHLKEKEGFN